MAVTSVQRPRTLPKLPRTSYAPQIEVTVRSGNKYMVAKDLLCKFSSVFDVGMKEKSKLHLPDVSDNTFSLFYFWLHGQASRVRIGRERKGLKRQKSMKKVPGRIREVFGWKESEVEEVEEVGMGKDGWGNDGRTSPNVSSTPAWLRDLNIEITLPGSPFPIPFQQTTNNQTAKSAPNPFFSNTSFIDLAAFASDFHIPQLEQDVMTIIVELHNLDPKERNQHWKKEDIERVYRSLPSESPLLRFVLKEVVLQGGAGMLHDDAVCEELPKDFFVDVARMLLLRPRPLPITRNNSTNSTNSANKSDSSPVSIPDMSTTSNPKSELADPCNFHDHTSELEMKQCKHRQAKDGALYAGLLKACIESEIVFTERIKATWRDVDGHSRGLGKAIAGKSLGKDGRRMAVCVREEWI
ncbi:hypothetical protein EK21DRAFT_117323 [Setomelanomma holmii]|uniref:BTB domain-containing protein n=1 Tax=Setomelanomma holmii TaxID=210430 RepID=A0A9P4H093_9PLEO|nr:hypothetical protein EK21DRAFT_117323 [Setomelanomma holmii]